MKYMNVILMSEFKNYIQNENFAEIKENKRTEDLLESNKDIILNDETEKEISTENEIPLSIMNEINYENFDFSCKEEKPEYNPSEENTKTFYCNICDKEFGLYFHLKQHIRNVHEKKKSYNSENFSKSDYSSSHLNSIWNENKISNKKTKDYKGKLLPSVSHLKKYIQSVHESHKYYKCDSCGKSFSYAGHLKRHIHTVHEGHKVYKCNYCGKSFSDGGTLRKHIHLVHEGHKDYKCES